MALASDSPLFTHDVTTIVTPEGMFAEYCIRPRRGNAVAVFVLAYDARQTANAVEPARMQVAPKALSVPRLRCEGV